MRNLKRALSLLLSSTMVLGMVVMGGSAAGYPDVTSKENVEAIEVLNAVGAMVGDNNGNFNPSAPVTREEMATIMCRLLDYTVSTYKGTTKFTDVSEWALPYVEACYTNGIIAGYSETQFGGKDAVTTGQAALMILKALGYFQEDGDFGSDWLVETVRIGAQIQLFDGVNNGANEALTRNDVAQMVLNGLKAECVEISSHDLASDGKGGFVTKAVYTARTGTGVKYDAISNYTDGRGDRIVNLGEDLYDGELVLRAADEAFGRPAVEWRYNSQSVGIYPTETELLKTYTAGASRGDLYSLVGSSVVKLLEDGKATLTVYQNGIKVSNPVVADYFTKNGSKNVGISGNGVVTEVYMDGDDNVTVVQINTYLVKATADYNTNKGTLSIETVDIDSDAVPALPTTIDNDDVNVENFKEGDYILVTYSQDTNEIMSAQAAEVLTGKVSEYTVTENVVIDGTTYKYNKLTGSDVSGVEYTINENAAVVLDAYGYIIYVDQAVSTSSYVYIADVSTSSTLGTKAIAAAFFTDGTSKEITLNKVYAYYGAAAGTITSPTDLGNSANVRGWYTYTVNADGEYTLTTLNRNAQDNNQDNGADSGQTVHYAVSATADNGTTEFTVTNGVVQFLKNAKDSTIKADTIKGDENTVFLVRDQYNDVTVYTGVANVPSIVAGGDANDVMINYAAKDGYATYVFIDLSKDGDKDSQIIDVNDIADFLFLLEELDGNKTVVEGSTYYKYKVIIDGEVAEKYLAEQMLASGNNKGDLYSNVKENKDGYITNGTPVTTGGKKYELTLSGLDDTITQSGKSLSVAHNSGSNDFIVSTDTDINLIIGSGVTELLKNPDASYETYLHISANALAGMLKNYYVDGTVYATVSEAGSEKATDIYVYVTGVSEIPDMSIAKVSGATVDGTAVNVYSSIADAVANATEVKANASVNVVGTGTGTMSYSVDKDYTDPFTQTDSTGSFTTTASDSKLDVVKITATSADSSKTDVKYVALKTVTKHTLTIKTSADSALVEINGVQQTVNTTGVTIDLKGTESVTVVVKAVSGSNALGNTTAALGGANATLWATGAQSWTVNAMTGTETLTLTLS